MQAEAMIEGRMVSLALSNSLMPPDSTCSIGKQTGLPSNAT